MANWLHVQLLTQSVEDWNKWREKSSEVQPDLSGVPLVGAKLSGANLSGANLVDADPIGADLSGANLRGANLFRAALTKANLTKADLSQADLRVAQLNSANLSNANLSSANLSEANLSDTNLDGANLSSSDLGGANLRGANLGGSNLFQAYLSHVNLDSANLSNTFLRHTILAHLDLRQAKGLAEIKHEGPSHIALDTILLPQDGSALRFLRGAGIPDEWIDFYRATMMHPIQYHSCFISYSSQDDIPARRFHADLQDRGVRCWFAPHDMKIGDKIRSRIDEAIHLQDKLLLILSEHSVASDWVEHEVETALARERKEKRTILFPIRLDDAILEREYTGWAALVQHERNIGDFTNWTDPQAYELAFKRLLHDLKTGISYER